MRSCSFTRSYVIKEIVPGGKIVTPVVNSLAEYQGQDYLFSYFYEERPFETRQDAEKAIEEFFYSCSEFSVDADRKFVILEQFGME